MDTNSVWRGLAYGGIAACLGDLVTMPMDVAKTRLQLAQKATGAGIGHGLEVVTRNVVADRDHFGVNAPAVRLLRGGDRHMQQPPTARSSE